MKSPMEFQEFMFLIYIIHLEKRNEAEWPANWNKLIEFVLQVIHTHTLKFSVISINSNSKRKLCN